MSRRKRYDEDGQYLLPSERDHEDEVFGGDDLELADHIAANMYTADSLTQKAALRNAKHDTLGQQAPFVRIVPPSILKGTLGGQQQVAHGQNAQVALWGGEDAETTAVSVCFAPVQQIASTPLDAVPVNDAFRPYGIVQFGTRGFLVKAEVDIGTGVQFSVPASMVSLQVALEPQPSGSTLAPGNMKLAGMLSFLPVTHTPNVTRTVYVDSLAAGNPETIRIPPFSRNFTLFRFATATDSISYRVLDSNGFGIYDDTFAAGSAMSAPVPLSGDAVYIRLTTAAVSTNVRAVFGLAF